MTEFVEMTNLISSVVLVLGLLVFAMTVTWWSHWAFNGMGKTAGEDGVYGPVISRNNKMRGNVMCVGLLFYSAIMICVPFIPSWFS